MTGTTEDTTRTSEERTAEPDSYRDYLNLDVLLTLQDPVVPREIGSEVVRAERFFIVTHQSCELWLAQIIGDLDLAAEMLETADHEGDLELALELLDRAQGCIRLLEQHVVCLQKIPFDAFTAFRPYLGTASGAQSSGFVQLDRRMGDETTPSPLYDAFRLAVKRFGTSLDELSRHGVSSGVLYRISDQLLGLGGAFWKWKITHLGLVSRIIGEQEGTGGSSGTAFLAKRITMPFPQLRLARGEVISETGEESPGSDGDDPGVPRSCPVGHG